MFGLFCEGCIFLTALFCDLDGLGAVAGAFSSLEGACCCLPTAAVSILLLLTGGGTVMDRSEGGLGGSGGGAGTSGLWKWLGR